LVATDRLSAFDVVSDQPVPRKGQVLTDVSVFWFKLLAQKMPKLKTHFITADWQEMVLRHAELEPYENQLNGRSMLVHKVDSILPIEAIVRGYLYGSALKDYLKTGVACGITLPQGMRKAEKLEAPLFTPSTKAPAGQHDLNISVQEAVEQGLLTQSQLDIVASSSLAVYQLADDFARQHGVILADTKFEFGLIGDQVVLADEVLTPDSSRFWPLDQYQPGIDPPSLDKQPVRDFLESLGWNKQPPMPELPAHVLAATTERYLKLQEMLLAA
jgi:phosphoribosylaminoimidazole-succinocarboxamide synthase